MANRARTVLAHVLRLAAAAAFVLGAAPQALAQGCAMCGSSFGENDPVTRAFSWSIIFLMATPYTIVAVIGGYFFYSYRRAPRRYRAAIIRFARAAGRIRRRAAAEGGEGDLA